MSDNKCKSVGCRKRPEKRYDRPGYRSYCSACRSQRFKRRNPEAYYYNIARKDARRRKIPFRLTRKQYVELWKKSGKWSDKVNGRGDWSVDRINVNRGYEPGNVRIISVQMNVEIFWAEQRWEVDFRWRERWSDRNGRPVDECPF